MSPNLQENNKSKNSKQKLIVIIGSLIVIGIILFGSINLYNKLNKVNDLNNRITEVAETDKEQPSIDDEDNNTETGTKATESPSPTSGVAEETQQPATTKPTAPTATNTDEVEQPESTPETTPKEIPTTKPDTALEKEKKKKEIDAKVTTNMHQLEASCRAESNSLVEQISQEISGDSESALQVIQDKFLSKITNAESSCDAQFDKLLKSAKDEYSSSGISNKSMPDWSTQYASAKSEARTAALNAIANALK